jgi:hypothetical protein
VKELSSAANFARALDRVKISGYFASVTALENSGMVGPVEWKLEETPVLKYSPVEDKEIADMELPVSDSMTKKNLRWVRLNNEKLENPKSFDSQVVYAVPAKAPRVFKKWQNDPRLPVLKRGERWYALLDLELRSPVLRASSAAPLSDASLRVERTNP